MSKRYIPIALALAAFLPEAALAGYTIGGIDLGSGQSETIIGGLLGVVFIYDIFKKMRKGEGGNTAAILLAMVVGAFQNGGFSSVQKAINVMVGVSVVQMWFDTKEDKTGAAGTAMRMVFGYIMVGNVSKGMDPMSAFISTLVGYTFLNAMITIFSRPETWDTLVHAVSSKTPEGEIADDDTRNLWNRFRGKAKEGGGAHAEPAETGSAKKLAEELRKLAKRIKPVGV